MISLLDLNAELPKAQKEIKAKYGILEDASRSGIGDFKLDLGIKSHNDSKVFTAQSQIEWSNLIGKVKNGLNNYSVVGNCIWKLISHNLICLENIPIIKVNFPLHLFCSAINGGETSPYSRKGCFGTLYKNKGAV